MAAARGLIPGQLSERSGETGFALPGVPSRPNSESYQNRAGEGVRTRKSIPCLPR